MGILAAVAAATREWTVAQNVMVMANVSRVSASVIADGEDLSVKQWVVQV